MQTELMTTVDETEAEYLRRHRLCVDAKMSGARQFWAGAVYALRMLRRVTKQQEPSEETSEPVNYG